MKKIIPLLFLVTVFMIPSFLSAAAKKNNKGVYDDNWDENWETTFFEREAEKIQDINKKRKQDKEEAIKEVEDSSDIKTGSVKADDVKIDKTNEVNLHKLKVHEKIIVEQKTEEPLLDNDIAGHYAGLRLFKGSVELSGVPTFDSWGAEVYAGMKKDSITRFEASLMYGVKSPAKGDSSVKLDSLTLMFNLLADIKLSGADHLAPYLGIGAGPSYLNIKNSLGKDNDLNFAYNLLAGFGYQINSQTILDVGVRYINYGAVKMDDLMIEADFDSVQFTLGLRRKF